MTMIEAVARQSAAAIGRALARGEVDPLALAEHYLERIAAETEPVFITVTAERARAEARAAGRRLAAGQPLSPLDGVPIAWKDLVDIAGTATTAASAVYRDSPIKRRDAPVAALAAAAGMVCLGKLNLTELAFSGLGLNPHFGTPANARGRDVRRAPGGSSAGSGVAVAANLAALAIGTDTGGSVRIPAAFNGVVGFKPTFGRIDKTGVFDLAPGLDSVGPLARTVEDVVLADAVLRGAVSPAVRRTPLAGVRLVVPRGPLVEDVDDDVAERFEAALKALVAAGAVIERTRLPALERLIEFMARHGSLIAAEAYHVHRTLVDGPEAARIDHRVVARIMGGKRMSADDVIALESGRRALAVELAGALGEALLVMPTTPHTAPAIDPLEADDALFHAVNMRTLRNTTPLNLLAMCALAIPSGEGAGGMPTSLMLAAPGGQDERLLGIGLEADRHLLPLRA